MTQVAEEFSVAARSLARDWVAAQLLDSGLTAAATNQAPVFPPVEWFQDPRLRELTPMQITPEGRIYGHMADWSGCHTGFPGVCVAPPRSKTGYAYFQLGEVDTAEGRPVSVGKITLGTGHASLNKSRAAAAAHYDNTGTAVADIAVGEDRFGIWIAGAVRPTLSTTKLRELRAASLSGDWRRVNGNLEMVAALAVNVPGYPIPRQRTAMLASAEPAEDTRLALVAAGIVTMSDLEIDARLEALADLALGGPVRAPIGFLGQARTAALVRPWDPALHPRYPEGRREGGRFAPKGGAQGDQATGDDPVQWVPGADDVVNTPDGTGRVVGVMVDTGEISVDFGKLDPDQVVSTVRHYPVEQLTLVRDFTPVRAPQAEVVAGRVAQLMDRHDRALGLLYEMGPRDGFWDPRGPIFTQAEIDVAQTAQEIADLRQLQEGGF